MNRYDFLKPLPKKKKTRKVAEKKLVKKKKRKKALTAVERLRRLLRNPQSVAMTGNGPSVRADLVEQLENAGHTYTTNMNHASILITRGDTSRITDKVRQARRRRIPIMSYEDFFSGLAGIGEGRVH